MNEDLLRDIADAIRQEPQAYKQNTWASLILKDSEEVVTAENVCGTTNCIAGWAVKLARPHIYSTLMEHLIETGCREDSFQDLWQDTASEELDIDYHTSMALFDACGKPTHGLTVPEALEKFAAGTPLEDVWQWEVA